MELNMGPHHPSTHGVLRVRLKLDGEIVRDADADIGYLHTGFEKSFEDKTYTQGITFSDRMDYLAPPINNVGFVSAVEKLIGVEVPPRAQAIRVIMMELARVSSHELWLGTTGLDLGVYSGFFYAWRDRDLALDLNEAYSGVRMMTSFTRVGGVAWDLPEGWLDQLQRFIDVMPGRSEGFKGPVGDVYAFVESPRGELGFYLVSDGTNKPYRMKVRPPSFCNLQALKKLVQGVLVADVIAIMGSLDFILGDCDR